MGLYGPGSPRFYVAIGASMSRYSLFVCLLIACCTSQPEPKTEEIGEDINISEYIETSELSDVTQEYIKVQKGARAFIASSADQLVHGPWAVGVVGDVVIENELVKFVIRNGTRGLYSPYDGVLVDADLKRPEGEPGNDQLFEMFPMIGLGRVFRPTNMEIVDDGSNSGIAVVRFTGCDGGMPIIDSVFATQPANIEVTTEYRLATGSRYLEISTTLRNTSGSAITIASGLVTHLGKRLNMFYDQCGPKQDCLSTTSGVRFIAGATKGISYALTVPAPKAMSMLLAVEGLMVLGTGTFDLEDGGEVTSTQYFIVSDGTIEDVVTAVKELRGEPLGTAVKVVVKAGDPFTSMDDISLIVRRSKATTGGYVSATRPGADGEALLHLEPGTYDIYASSPGAANTSLTGIQVTDEPFTIGLTTNPSGRLRVIAHDKEDRPVTAALTLQAGKGAAMGAGIVLYAAIPDGDTTIPVLPGDYTANVARGLLWSLHRQDVSVPVGGMAEVKATIEPIADTTGYVMVNTHEHTEWSPDSSVKVEDRVWNAIANGIDILVATDHDHFGSRQETIEEMGKTKVARGFTGCEVSPTFGHTTVAGCRKPPAIETYYSVNFVEYDSNGNMLRVLTPSEVFMQARDLFDCQFLAVNHPYRDEGMFVQFGIDPNSDPAEAEPELDLHLVDGMEIYNRSDTVSSILATNMPAWFNLLNRGYSIAAIGGSDEHGYSASYGSPRNMVPVTKGLSDPDLEDEIFNNIKAFKNLVLGGPLIRLTVNGLGLGGTVIATTGNVQVHIEVLAPTWMGLEFARVYANGQVVKDIKLSTDGVERANETFELQLLTDAYIVAAAGSTLPEHRMLPVSPRQPFSITNPVFVDVDGGGYTPILKNSRTP